MKILRFVLAATLLVGLLSSCGGDDATDESTTTSTEATSTSGGTTTTATTGSSTTASSTTSTTESSTTSSDSTTTTVPVLEQPAIWPAPGVVFDDPETAAADFVSKVFGVPPNLGEFQQGDSRSGEIEVYSPEEGGSTSIRSVLLLRQLGPNDGWFVLAAVSDINTITTPASGSQVAAGPVEVSGQGRGFEGLVVVEAFTAGETPRLDQQQAQGGSTEATEPYTVTLDLSGVTTGDTVLLLVRGGVGLDTDPGEFSAIPVTVG
ncbi:MAG: hypothetical protein WBM50_17495 [Acidimicrobiales bacterium]